MFESKNFKFVWLPVSQLNLHENIKLDVRQRLSGITNLLTSETGLSEDALELLLTFHPIVAIKRRNGVLSCVAGLRSYSLAQTRLPPEQAVPVLVLDQIPTYDLNTLTASDAYLTHLLYGLDGRAWDIDLMQLWEGIPSEKLEEYTPGLKSKKKLADTLGVNRRRFSSSPSAPTSLLKNTPGNLVDSDQDE